MAKAVRDSEVKAIIQRLRKPDRRAVNAITDGMQAAANKIYEISQFYVPMDTMDLAASGKVTQVYAELYENKTLNYVLEVSYHAPYAVYVHEDPTKAHGAEFNIKYADEIAKGLTHPRRPQEQFKFLEIAVRDITQVKAAFHKGFL